MAGHGGIGGVAIDGALAATTDTSSAGIALGGNAGTGSNAGTVQVTAGAPGVSSAISTAAPLSNGIVALSLGGMGGMGGTAVSAGAEIGGANMLGVALAGNGGAAGASNAVTVADYAAISTTGGLSSGIVALSIGGHGGIGGVSVDAGLSITADSNIAGVSVGGNGGTGGTAGPVSVTLAQGGTIATAGDGSTGIVALSLGGMGGMGGILSVFHDCLPGTDW